MRPHAHALIAPAAIALFLVGGITQAVEAPATGDSCMVVTAHPLATQAAVAVLRDGGNAADAVVCAAFALAVVEPYASGLGGGGFVVGWNRSSDAGFALDCRETAPAAATHGMYRARDGGVDPAASQDGPRAVAVPGLVRGLWDLHVREGRLPWARLIAPAAAYARDGYPASAMLIARLAEEAPRLDETLRSVFIPGGVLPQAGQLIVQPDLAATLSLLADQGPDPFYTGDLAERIAAAVAGARGTLTMADLASYRTVWRAPVTGTYRGLTVVSMPPPSSGGVHLIEMLHVIEGFDLTAAGYGSAAAWHPLLEAMKFAFADRSRFLGDPDFVAVPVRRLTSRAYADSLRARIPAEHAIPCADIAGVGAPDHAGHTSHISIVDSDGNAVAATFTINLTFGSGVMAASTGIILNDEMDDFVAAPGVANAFGLVGGEANSIAPGKRPLSSMTPTIVLDADGAVFMVTGSPGGSRIITTTLQTIVHVVDFGMDALQAVSVPRIHHQWSPPTTFHEPYGISPDTRARLAAMGYAFTERQKIGLAQTIVRDRARGLWTGASDPRGMGLAAGF